MEDRVYYPLLPSQELIFLSTKYSVFKRIMNIGTSLWVDEDLDQEILKKATEEAILRNDAFAIRLTKVDQNTVQHFDQRVCLSLDTMDFRDKTWEELNAALVGINKKSMKLYDSPLARIRLVRCPEGYSGIFMSVSHLIMDSWAVGVFYSDIIGIYLALKKGSPYPKPLYSCEENMKKDIEYQTSQKHEKDVAFWKEELSKSEPLFVHINGSEVLEKYRKKKKDATLRRARSMTLRTNSEIQLNIIEKETAEKIRKFTQENGYASTYILILMGLRTYLSKVNGNIEDIGFYNTVARRGTLAEKRSGGTSVHILPFRTIIDGETTFENCCKVLMDKQNSVFRHADISPMEHRKILRDYFPSTQLEGYFYFATSYIPFPENFGEGLNCYYNWYKNGTAATPFYLVSVDGDGSGGIKCFYEYQVSRISPERIKMCHDYIRKVIEVGIENPEIKLKELWQISLNG